MLFSPINNEPFWGMALRTRCCRIAFLDACRCADGYAAPALLKAYSGTSFIALC